MALVAPDAHCLNPGAVQQQHRRNKPQSKHHWQAAPTWMMDAVLNSRMKTEQMSWKRRKLVPLVRKPPLRVLQGRSKARGSAQQASAQCVDVLSSWSEQGQRVAQGAWVVAGPKTALAAASSRAAQAAAATWLGACST